MTIFLEITSWESLVSTVGIRFCGGENERMKGWKFYVRRTFDTFQLEAICKLNKKVRISPLELRGVA